MSELGTAIPTGPAPELASDPATPTGVGDLRAERDAARADLARVNSEADDIAVELGAINDALAALRLGVERLVATWTDLPIGEDDYSEGVRHGREEAARELHALLGDQP